MLHYETICLLLVGLGIGLCRSEADKRQGRNESQDKRSHKAPSARLVISLRREFFHLQVMALKIEDARTVARRVFCRALVTVVISPRQ
jgi:hypothetical protein